MSNVLIEKNKIDILANAISVKSGEPVTMTLSEMVAAVDGIETGGGITPTGNIDITSAGITDVTEYATATVPAGEMYATTTSGFYTESGARKWHYRGTAVIDSADDYGKEGYIADQTVVQGSWEEHNAVPSGTTITPSTSSQTIGGYGYMMEGAVTVGAIPIATVGDEDYQSEYYTENNVRKFRTRYWKEYNSGGYVGPFDDHEAVVEDWKTYNAVPSGTTITPSTSSQSIGGVNYMMEGAVTVEAMPSGSEGTPTATKGTVSNHSVSVTPSVTNSAGYISGGTHDGTAVTVSASELVSGTYNVTSSGNKDVTNYATASVPAGSATPAASITSTGATVSTGTNTLTFSKTVSNTPQVSSGFVSSGTAGNTEISLTASVTTKGATTYTPTTSNQTIASGTYLTGAQTISGDANLTAGNIKSGVTIFNVAGTYTGGSTHTATISGSGNMANLYIQFGSDKYYTDGDTIEFQAGDEFSLVSSGRVTSGTIVIDGVTVASGNPARYTYELPDANLDITLYYGSSGTMTIVSKPPLGTKTVTENGTYDAEDDGYDGYSSVTVNVSGGGGVTVTDVANTTGTTCVITSGSEPSGTYETLFAGGTTLQSGNPYPFWWIEDLSSVTITAGTEWRITLDFVEYLLTAALDSVSGYVVIGNPLYAGGNDDGSGIDFAFLNQGWGAWSGEADMPDGPHSLKIERKVSS